MHILLYLMFLFLLFSNIFVINCYSSNNIIDRLILKKQILLNDEFSKEQLLRIYQDGNITYLINKSNKLISEKDTIKIHEIDSNIILKYSFSFHGSDLLRDFVIRNNKIYLLNQFSVHQYNIEKDTISFSNILVLNAAYDKIKTDFDKLILLNSCSSCSMPGMRALILDTNLKIIQNYEFNLPSDFQMSYYRPHRRLEYQFSKFLISGITNYEIKIFDINSNSEQILNRDDSIFNNSSSVSEMLVPNDYNYWKLNNKFNDSLFCTVGRILLTDFVNDSTILVCYSKSDRDCSSTNKFCYDIWVFNRLTESWYLKYQDLYFVIPNENNKPQSLGEIIGGISIQYFISNEYIITTNSFSFDMTNSDFLNMTFKSIYEFINNYKKSNPKRLISLFIYKLIP